ncbi:MAG: type I-E CRISPR-associated protein Cse2/CasB [Cellvibrionales bacterium]|nr:type I-E CRISPR-associated protein Cse2/CasB [Cellvibrionales bacterium]
MNDEKPKDIGTVCKDWWKAAIKKDDGPARKTRAELRRAATPLEALGIPAVHDLYAALVKAGYDLRHHPAGDGPNRLALIAIAIARIDNNSNRRESRLACRLGERGEGDRPRLSEMRFHRLLRAETPHELIRPLSRALQMLKGEKGGVNLSCLADNLYWWNDRVRTSWCFDYFGASAAKPEQLEETTT